MQEDEEYSIRALEAGDKAGSISAGRDYQPLKSFIQDQAHNYHDANIAKTYVAITDDLCIRGYISLTCSEVDLQDTYAIADCPDADRHDSMPAIKIARLLVDKRCRGQGIGPNLVATSIAMINDEIAPKIGCRFIIADAKQGSIEFYINSGFSLLDTDENRNKEHPIVFIDLYKLNGIEAS